MARGILVGPVPGLPADDSVVFIRTQIFDRLPHRESFYEFMAEELVENKTMGIVVVLLQFHQEDSVLDGIYAIVLAMVLKTSIEIGHDIPCVKLGDKFGGGDNEGNVPNTPVVGPPKGPPTLFEHEAEPEQEYLAPIDIAVRGPDWWKDNGV